ncbi:MAG: lytic transglycosylase domain-containing protein [Candidatus Kapaibacterium sp.]
MLLQLLLLTTLTRTPIATTATTAEIFAITNTACMVDSLDASRLGLVPYAREIKLAAIAHHVPAALLAAFIQEESFWNPWAERAEPTYLKNPRVRKSAAKWSAAHNGTPTMLTELHDRSRSMGLMQVMGEVAREQAFTPRFLSELFVPMQALDQGALLLRKLLDRYPRDTLAAISAYNQGSARTRKGAKHNVFLNARYVYRVSIAWRAYATLFSRETNEH